MSATINGWPWEADLIYATRVTPTGEPLLTINGSNEAQWSIVLNARLEVPGTHTVGGASPAAMFVSDDNKGRGWLTHVLGRFTEPQLPGTSGTITFTTMTTKRAVGTFSFLAVAPPQYGGRGTMTVTNGRFDVAF